MHLSWIGFLILVILGATWLIVWWHAAKWLCRFLVLSQATKGLKKAVEEARQREQKAPPA